MTAILRDEPPELTQSGRNVSPALDHIVRHCLEKDRENRFQTAKDVAFALSEASGADDHHERRAPRRAGAAPRQAVWIAVAGSSVLAAAGLLLCEARRPAGAAPGGVKRVAVLPFENLGAPRTTTSRTASPTRSAAS